MGGFNFIFCVAENFIKTVGFDFIVSNANDFIKNSESSTLSTKNIKTSFLYPTDKNRQVSSEICRFLFYIGSAVGFIWRLKITDFGLSVFEIVISDKFEGVLLYFRRIVFSVEKK